LSICKSSVILERAAAVSISAAHCRRHETGCRFRIDRFSGKEIMRLNAFRSPRNIARNVSGITAGITLSLLYVATAAAASPSAAVPDAAASDPARLGWMVGSPPPPDRTLRFEDGSYFQFPAMRWSVSHFRQLMPTVNISRGLGAPVALPRQDSVALNQRIDALRFVPLGAAEPMTWEQSLAANYTDGIVVLHRGRVVYNAISVVQQDGSDAAMSVTKSSSAPWAQRWWQKARSTPASAWPGLCGRNWRPRHSVAPPCGRCWI